MLGFEHERRMKVELPTKHTKRHEKRSFAWYVFCVRMLVWRG